MRPWTATAVLLAACSPSSTPSVEPPRFDTAQPEETGTTAGTGTETGAPPDTSDTAQPEETATPDDTSTPDTVPDTEPQTGDPDLLCAIEVDCGGAAIPDDPKIPCEVAIVSGDGVALYDGGAGMELRGRSSLGFAKPQYSVELREPGAAVLPAGSVWRYHDGGADLGTAWRAVAYDDAAWPAGPGPLGYGDAQATVIGYGPDAGDKHITAYFRGTFEVADPAALAGATLSLLRDDGAVVYLNEQEIRRDHMPAGPIAASTLAAVTVGGAEETTYVPLPLPTEHLVAGTNLIAVELHQAAPSSSDTSFDLSVELPEAEADVDLLGFGEESDWIFNSAYVDRALFRAKLTYDLFQSFAPERYGPQSAFCAMTLDGSWVGIYLLTEKVKRAAGRVDLPEDPGDGTSFLVKLDDEDGIVPNIDGSGTWQLVYPRPEDVTAAQETGIAGWLGAWQDAFLGPDPADPATGIFAYLDLDSAVDLVIAEELSKNVDAYYLSLYLAKAPGGPMHLIPWDIDLSYGQPSYGNNESPESWVSYRPAFIGRMAEVPAFREALVARWAELRAGPVTEAAIEARIDGYLATMGDAAYDNFVVWPIEDIEFGWSGVDYLYEVGSFDEEVARVRAWIPQRIAWMDANIDTW